MKRKIKALTIALCLSFTCLPAGKANAATIPIIEIIRAAIVKVIKAIDLKIQRLQNKTIWLQNSQKVLENTLSKLKLQEISDWTKKQREQYQDYFDELKKVKLIIAQYQRIKDIAEKQAKLTQAYNRAWQLFQQDENFNGQELQYMEQVYSGILSQSVENMERILMVVQSYSTQMSDAERLELIDQAADQVDMNYFDLLQFNQQNIAVSISRAKDRRDIERLRQLYGIN